MAEEETLKVLINLKQQIEKFEKDEVSDDKNKNYKLIVIISYVVFQIFFYLQKPCYIL
jgi:hypothetical protein